jgi:hypothetical protein
MSWNMKWIFQILIVRRVSNIFLDEILFPEALNLHLESILDVLQFIKTSGVKAKQGI